MLTLFRFIKRLLRDIFRTNWWRNGENGRHDNEHSDTLIFNFYAKCHFFQCRYAGAATLGMTTCSIMTLGIKASVVTLSISYTQYTQHNNTMSAECRGLFIVMLNVIILSLAGSLCSLLLWWKSRHQQRRLFKFEEKFFCQNLSEKNLRGKIQLPVLPMFHMPESYLRVCSLPYIFRSCLLLAAS